MCSHILCLLASENRIFGSPGRRSLTENPSHGLSYTTFAYSDLNITPNSASVTITNTGVFPGAEVTQLYVAPNAATSSIPRPRKELKGFTKVFLEPGEARRMEIPFDRFTTAFWDESLREWVCEKGEYRVLVGASSADVRVEGVLRVEETTTWRGL
jgi:beta-glucosidase